MLIPARFADPNVAPSLSIAPPYHLRSAGVHTCGRLVPVDHSSTAINSTSTCCSTNQPDGAHPCRNCTSSICPVPAHGPDRAPITVPARLGAACRLPPTASEPAPRQRGLCQGSLWRTQL